VHGHAVAEEPDAKLAHQLEVFAPASVMTAALDLIHTQGALPDVGALFPIPVANMKNGLAGARRWAILDRNANTGLRGVAAS
jgi:hypothetical protein